MALDQDQITLLAHVLGGMGGNISAGNPAFQGVPQSLVQAANFAKLMNTLGGNKSPAGTTSTATPSSTTPADNNPNTPPQRMKLTMDGVPGDLTQALTNMYFGGYSPSKDTSIPNWPPLKGDEANIPSPFDRKKEVANYASVLGGISAPF